MTTPDLIWLVLTSIIAGSVIGAFCYWRGYTAGFTNGYQLSLDRFDTAHRNDDNTAGA